MKTTAEIFNMFILWPWLVSVLISIRVARRFGPDFIEALVDRNEGYASKTILFWFSVVAEEFADSLRIIYWFFIISSLLIRYFCYWARRANENWFLFFGVILRGLTLFRGSWHRDHQSVLSKSLFLNIYSDSKSKNNGILYCKRVIFLNLRFTCDSVISGVSIQALIDIWR